MSEDMIYPIDGYITTGFGFVITSGVPRYHAAIDISSDKGYQTKIVASKDGTVTQIRTDSYEHIGADWWNGDPNWGGYGNFVTVKHNDDTYTRYCHLRADGGVLVATEQKVRQGQHIGWMGSTGKSTGPHIHFEKYKGDTNSFSRINPLPLSAYKEIKTLTEDEVKAIVNKAVADALAKYNLSHYTDSHQYLAWAQNVGEQPKLLEKVDRVLNKLIRGFTIVYEDPPASSPEG